MGRSTIKGRTRPSGHLLLVDRMPGIGTWALATRPFTAIMMAEPTVFLCVVFRTNSTISTILTIFPPREKRGGIN